MVAPAAAAREASLRSDARYWSKCGTSLGKLNSVPPEYTTVSGWLAMVVHLENAGDVSGCVARRQVDGDGSVADRDFHPVGGDDIALWLAGRIAVDGGIDHIPIVHHNTRAIA